MLTVVGRGADFADAIARAYAGVAQIHFDGMQYRRDIGRKALSNRTDRVDVKYSVITFGCRVNQADSLGFEEELRAAARVAAPPEDADLVVVNTCSVTASADQGARQTIRRIARDNPARAHRRDRLLRDAAPGRGRRRCRTSSASSPNDDKPRLRRLLDLADRSRA